MINTRYPADGVRTQAASAAQQQALTPHGSVWVSANAGTGKTTVLTQRLLALLLADPTLEPRQILALTFTRVAAGEMAERFPRLVAQWAAETDEALAQKIPEKLGLVFRSDMPERLRSLAESVRLQPPTLTTIHGFAQQVLAALPAVAGLPEGFGLLDETAQKRVLKQVHDGLLLNPRDLIKTHLNTLLIELGENALHDLPKMLVNAWGRIETVLGPHGLAQGVAQVLARIDDALALPPEAEIFATQLPHPAEIDAFRAMGKAVPTTEEAYVKALLTKDLRPSSRAMLKADKEKLTEAQLAMMVAAQQALSRIMKARDAWRGRKLTEALLVWAAQVQAVYRAEKTARGVVDFNDLLRALEQVLASPEEEAAAWLWHRLDTRYRHMVVDEAQDNNASQSRIVQLLAENLLAGEVGGATRTVMAVGDVKQSIYRFQGAQPQWFLALRALLETWSEDARIVQMTYTFRNSPAVLQAVNAVFNTPELATMVQGEATPWPTHTSVFANRPSRVELWPQEEVLAGDVAEEDESFDESEDETETDDTASKRWLLAEERAARVPPSAKMRCLTRLVAWLKAQHGAGVVLPSTDKPLRWGDVLIVVQRNETAQFLGAILKRAGVPVAAGVGLAPLRVRDGAALVRVAYNKADHLALAQVLKGLCGYSDAQILSLNQAANGGPWFAALPEAAAEPRGLKAFFAALPAVCLPSGLVLRAAVWWQVPLNEWATLLAWAETADNSPLPHGGALASLVSRLETEDLPAASLPEADPEDDGQGEGAVRILTTHRAKGLEAPLVILPETTRSMSASNDELLFGDGVMFYKTKKEISNLEDDLREIEAQACTADALRGLYVAMTRAVDWLVIAGWSQKKKSRQ